MQEQTITKMKFVGGQEDGRFYDVHDEVDLMKFHEHLNLDDVPFIGGESLVAANVTRKIITYVRQGDLMVCEE